MNIFFINDEPEVAAKQLCSRHIVKMPLESLQILNAVIVRHGATENQQPLNKNGLPMKVTHSNHPSTLWAGNTKSNYKWLCRHAKAMCQEYTSRYNKRHFCEDGIDKLSKLDSMIPKGNLQPFAIAINDEMKCRKLPEFESLSAVEKYRAYYRIDKREICSWGKGWIQPEWF